MNFAVVILAGGEGRRLGGGKPLRMLGGKTLLDRAICRASTWSDHLAVAVRDPGQLRGCEVVMIEDSVDIEGPMGGLCAALRFARGKRLDAVLTIACDMPFLPADLPCRLGEAIQGKRAAIAASEGRLHPVCGLWRVECLDRIAGYLASGQRSLGGFAAAVGRVTVSWEALPQDPFFNINSLEDLAAAERMLTG